MPHPPGTPRIVHGFYKARERHCDACGTRYTAHTLASRYCSTRCRVQRGPWSFKVASQTNARVLGTVKET